VFFWGSCSTKSVDFPGFAFGVVFILKKAHNIIAMRGKIFQKGKLVKIKFLEGGISGFV